MATIVQVMPVWGRIETVQALTGIPDNALRRLANEGHVRARKIDGSKANSACVYRVADVIEWLENDAAKAPQFKLVGDV